jgi:hippurate hydrolase
MPEGSPTATLEGVRSYHTDLTGIRRDIHAHPELGLATHRTAEVVARLLKSWGIEVHRMVDGAGVVGVLRCGNGLASIGLRADMDALPIHERTDAAYRSNTPGVMHACGHDGHTTMLLGAARYLAETRQFNGTVNFIFQPGEEGAGGALAMLREGLLETFPSDELYGLHNRPGMPVGHFSITPGTAMAGGAFFDITIRGRGAHGARPNDAIDPVIASCHIGTALQTVVARNLPLSDMGVLSITKIDGGDAYNVIPECARMGGTVRAMKRETLSTIELGLKRVAVGVAEALGATAEVDYRLIFVPLVNAPGPTRAIADAAAELVGEANVDRNKGAAPASEDFAFMLEKVPGAYINLGNGKASSPVHNDRYDFNDEAIPYGVAIFARLVERTLVPEPGPA